MSSHIRGDVIALIDKIEFEDWEKLWILCGKALRSVNERYMGIPTEMGIDRLDPHVIMGAAEVFREGLTPANKSEYICTNFIVVFSNDRWRQLPISGMALNLVNLRRHFIILKGGRKIHDVHAYVTSEDKTKEYVDNVENVLSFIDEMDKKYPDEHLLLRWPAVRDC